MNDIALQKMIGEFIKHNRLNQNKSQSEVAKTANISRSTLSLLERGENTSLSTLIQVMRVLGILYLFENFEVTTEISPIEYAKMKKKERQRASGNKVSEDNPKYSW